jgi:glycosyltransferase involved in cell wall biosynthesis
MISIIIPAFNRYHLMGGTLDSILKQSYQDWECIVVDDGSKDYTSELMEFYCSRDFRIRYYYRPGNRPKGANACRNYGFEKSRGKYIQWFDSDDLMHRDSLALKIQILETNEIDFVVAKTAGFKDPDPNQIIEEHANYYQFDQFSISNFNYVTQNLNWLSPDFLGKRELCEKVRFNEDLTSSQEYNYFSKLTCYSVKASLIDKVLTLRRMHNDSIRANKKDIELTQSMLVTWVELYKILPKSASEEYLLLKLANLNQREIPNFRIFIMLIFHLINQGRFEGATYLFLYTIYYSMSGKGECLRTRFMRTLAQNWLKK